MKNKRLLIGFILIFAIMYSSSVFAQNSEIAFIESEAYCSNYSQSDLRESTNTTTNLLTKKMAINPKFNLREYINIKAKDQQKTNFCWTFSTNAMLETNLQLTQNEELDFSERFLAYAASRTFKNNQINEDGMKDVTTGGNQYIGLKYYSAGIGPILEKDMPFENNMDLIELSEIQNKEVAKQIDSYVVFPSIYKEKENGVIKYKYKVADSKEKKEYTKEELLKIRNSIKEHIVQYGGISATTCISEGKYFNNQENIGESTAHYCGVEGSIPDHAVTIIGWDDNYAATNFNENNRPVSPGAYIVLNSHGENLYDNGCMYISYEDVNIEKLCLGVTGVSDVNYEKIYQHEKSGPLEKNIYANDADECIIGNIFNIDENDKYLTQVSFSICENTEVKITTKINEEEILIQSNKLYEKRGFYTVKLDNPIELHGDTITVYLKVKKENIVLPIENTQTSEYAVANKGESIYNIGNSGWRDLAEDVEGNFCIKAFTSSTLGKPDVPDAPDVPDVPDVPDKPKYSKGDANQDGVIDMLDIIKICKHILEKEILTGEKFEFADVNSDGKINTIDIIRVIKIILES